MDAWRKLTKRYESISWMLIAAILLVTLVPVHYHLHHLFSADASKHAHVVDIHLLADATDSDHHDNDDHSFSATPDGVLKTKNSVLPPFFLIAVLLVFLPILANTTRFQPYYPDSGLKRNYRYLFSLLRAPPLH